MAGGGDRGTGDETEGDALGPVPDPMVDPVQRRRHARLRERMFGATERRSSFGRYELGPRLGAGAMGVVHRARDRTLDRPVALKILREAVGVHRARLIREAQALAQLSHPNVIEVYEVGEIDGEAFVAIELVEGETLRAWQRRDRSRPWREIVAVYRQAALGLAAAHAQGLVHRDFKPDNVMVGRDGRVRVLDFGLARPIELEDVQTEQATEATSSTSAPLDARITRTGALMGTPAYLAPEVIAGAPADARSDQFAFGVALFEALQGRRPFAGANLAELLLRVLDGRRAPGPLRSDLPVALGRAIERTLSLDPARRFPDLDAVVAALDAVTAPRRWSGWAIGAVLVGVVAGVVPWVLPTRSPAERRCEAGDADLGTVWNPRARADLGDRWQGEGADPSPAATMLLDALDGYASRWQRASDEVCTALASAPDPAFDLRWQCLGARRRGLADFVESLRTLPTAHEGLGRALALVDALPDAECRRNEERFPLPDDPARVQPVQEVREALEGMARRCVLHGMPACRPALDAAVARARALDHPPLLALALHEHGVGLEREGALPQAEAVLSEAYFVARGAGYDHGAARSAVRLVQLVGYRNARAQEGRDWARLAEAALGAPPSDPRLQGDLLNNRGLVWMQAGEADRAAEDYRAAIEAYQRALGPDAGPIAITRANLAQVAYEAGDFPRAIAELDEALEIRTRHFGPDHPASMFVLNNRALIHKERDDLEHAEADLERAVEIGERNLGTSHAELGLPLVNLARVQSARGAHDTALRSLQHAREIFATTLPEDHPDRLELDTLIAVESSRAGHADDVVATLRRQLRIQRDVLGAVHPVVARTSLGLGEVLLRTGDLPAAERALLQTATLVEQLRGPEHDDVAEVATSLGECRLERGDPDGAVEVLTQAWALRRARGPSAIERARTAFALARAQVAAGRGDVDQARDLARQASEIYRAAGPGHAETFAEIERWRATIEHGPAPRPVVDGP